MVVSLLRMQSVQNLGLAIVPIVAGVIVDKKGYLMLETFFCAMLCGQLSLSLNHMYMYVSAIGCSLFNCEVLTIANCKPSQIVNNRNTVNYAVQTLNCIAYTEVCIHVCHVLCPRSSEHLNYPNTSAQAMHKCIL